MINNKFKLSALAIAMVSAGTAHAALYKVVEVSPPSSLTYGTDTSGTYYKSAFGTAIQSSGSDTSCFGRDCTTTTTTYALGGETRRQTTMAGQPVDGIPYRLDAPFGLDNRFYYAGQDYTTDSSRLQSYCDNELMYQSSICDAWGDVHWTEWQRELTGSSIVNAYGFYQNSGTSTEVDSTTNTLINGIDSSGAVIGFQIEPGQARIASSITPYPTTVSSSSVGTSGGARFWKEKTDGSYTYFSGSNLTSYTNDYGSFYSSKGAIWSSADITSPEDADWGSSITSQEYSSSNKLAQGSIRDFMISGSTLYGVGFNTEDSDSYYMSAAIFKYTLSSGVPTYDSTTFVSSVVVNDDYTYTNSVVTAVNDNGVAVGEAKLSSSDNGSPANRLFVIPDVTASSPSVSLFSEGTGEIGFSGAGGHVNAINNDNDIVGQIDSEAVRENDGKPRRKRGFIYPYSDSTNGSIFENKAWLLDDLTNGDNDDGTGDYSTANNKFRILSANDINDAGVIAATAIKCPAGYASTAHDASCTADNERTVAVKLIPINGVSSDDISARSYDSSSESVSRSGGPVGVMTILSLFGFAVWRRKK